MAVASPAFPEIDVRCCNRGQCRSRLAASWLGLVAIPEWARAPIEKKTVGRSRMRDTRLAIRVASVLLVVALVQAAWRGYAQAQVEGLHISLHRRAGYSLGSQVQGAFELRAESHFELASVAYYIDGAPVGERSATPFPVRFSTGDYAPGWHELRGEARTDDGRSLDSNVLRVEFVTSRAAWDVLRRIVVPAGVIVGGAAIIVFVLSFVTARGRRSRKLTGRADGSTTSRPDIPRPPAHEPTPEEEHRRRIEESRYTNL